MTAVPDEGFVFAGWTASSGGSYSSATISFTMPQNADAGGVVLTANFKADAHEHNYAEIEDTRVNPTCTNNGSAKYKCTICGEVIEKELPALGHDWDGGVVSNGVITFACRREGCGETRTEAVQATPTPSPSPVPTPTATPEQHVHNFQLVSDTATCAADGVKTYQCSCGEQMTDPSPATGNHSWQLTGHTDPQVGADGSNVYTCSVCGQTMTETIPALPAPDPEPEPAPEPTVPEEPAPAAEPTGDPEITE